MTAVDPCDWCEEVLQPFLDRDLTDAERKVAEGHLEGCSYCAKRYRFEEGLRRTIDWYLAHREEAETRAI